MKIVGILGILLFLFGGLVLIIGLVVCFNTWTSDYATSACTRAAQDKEKFDEARARCGSTTSDCYQRATIGLTSEDECEHNTAFMRRQMWMGIIPAVVGVLLAIVGLIMGVGGFVMGRKKAVPVAN